MKKLVPSLFFIVFFIIYSCNIQKKYPPLNTRTDTTAKRGDIRIMFYNCENFFDIYNDSVKLDDEFTPEGKKHWTFRRFLEKVSHISKVIVAIGGWQPPEIIGLCEIENRYVLNYLTQKGPLKKIGYKIIHYESPDRRGIDVGFLYLPNKFHPIMSKKIPVNFPPNMGKKTRDILYVKGTINNGDTLHIFVNHWPSRWGGMLETEPKRMFVAALLRKNVDSIFQTNPKAKIIIIGDLNDYPTNRSLLESLKAKGDFKNIKTNELYNLSYYLQEVKGKFSHKHQGEAGILDQIIVSGALLDTNNSVYTTKDDAHVFDAPFLREEDANYAGYKPFRTYIGYKYHGGFSDHFPVYLDLFIKKRK